MKQETSRFVVALAAFFAFVVHQTFAITIPTVPVGNAGNAADFRYEASGVGAVAYDYRIGATEVSNAQYAAFLNGVDSTGANNLSLFNVAMSNDAKGGILFDSGAADGAKYVLKSGHENNPVIYVSWYSAIRFTNWLHNGQGAGDTETGAYTLLGGTPDPANGGSIIRNPGAKWWLPSEDEWYKAAYHKNDGVTGNYWNYPTSTDTMPHSAPPPGSDAPDSSNVANWIRDDGIVNGYDDGFATTGNKLWQWDESVNYLTDVGAYPNSTSPYGTLDQGGNSLEWTEDNYPNPLTFNGTGHIVRGGFWFYDSGLHASGRYVSPIDSYCGFRVATVVPEPGAIVLLSIGAFLLASRRLRATVAWLATA